MTPAPMPYVIVNTQTSRGTTWQKVSTQVIAAMHQGHQVIEVHTNSDNPSLDDLTAAIDQLKATIPTANVKLVTI